MVSSEVQNRAIEGPRKFHETRELQQRMVDKIVRYLERMTIEVRSKYVVINRQQLTVIIARSLQRIGNGCHRRYSSSKGRYSRAFPRSSRRTPVPEQAMAAEARSRARTWSIAANARAVFVCSGDSLPSVVTLSARCCCLPGNFLLSSPNEA